jgi:hypothetical protein
MATKPSGFLFLPVLNLTAFQTAFPFRQAVSGPLSLEADTKLESD